MFEGIESWFHKLLGSISKEEKLILSYVIPIAESDLKNIVAAALPIAKTIVSDTIASGTLKGTPARDTAVSQLKDTLTKQGIAGVEDVGLKTFNWIVETALSNLSVGG